MHSAPTSTLSAGKSTREHCVSIEDSPVVLWQSLGWREGGEAAHEQTACVCKRECLCVCEWESVCCVRRCSAEHLFTSLTLQLGEATTQLGGFGWKHDDWGQKRQMNEWNWPHFFCLIVFLHFLILWVFCSLTPYRSEMSSIKGSGTFTPMQKLKCTFMFLVLVSDKTNHKHFLWGNFGPCCSWVDIQD